MKLNNKLLKRTLLKRKKEPVKVTRLNATEKVVWFEQEDFFSTIVEDCTLEEKVQKVVSYVVNAPEVVVAALDPFSHFRVQKLTHANPVRSAQNTMCAFHALLGACMNLNDLSPVVRFSSLHPDPVKGILVYPHNLLTSSVSGMWEVAEKLSVLGDDVLFGGEAGESLSSRMHKEEESSHVAGLFTDAGCIDFITWLNVRNVCTVFSCEGVTSSQNWNLQYDIIVNGVAIDNATSISPLPRSHFNGGSGNVEWSSNVNGMKAGTITQAVGKRCTIGINVPHVLSEKEMLKMWNLSSHIVTHGASKNSHYQVSRGKFCDTTIPAYAMVDIAEGVGKVEEVFVELLENIQGDDIVNEMLHFFKNGTLTQMFNTEKGCIHVHFAPTYPYEGPPLEVNFSYYKQHKLAIYFPKKTMLLLNQYAHKLLNQTGKEDVACF